MAVTVTMPQLGESVTEGTISKWLKQPGERVERYEPIAEVITDKVNAEVPAPSDGVMGDLIAAEGDTVPVGGAMCVIRGLDEAGAPAASAPAPAAAAAAPAPAPAPEPARTPEPPAPTPAPATSGPRPVPPVAEPPAPAPAAPEPPMAVPMAEPVPVAAVASAAPAPAAPADLGGAGLHVSPAVRMLAREHAVDLTQIPGSGLGGRITKKDILEWVQRRDSRLAAAAPDVPTAVPEAAIAAPSASTAAPSAAPAAPAPAAAAPVAPAPPAPAADILVPLTPQRRAIAEHMSRSVQTSPHAWVMVEADMSAVAALRAKHRAAFEQRTGVKLTYLPFVAQAVIGALRRHPTLNATWTAEGIVLKRDINLGIAVALEDSLVVPVIHGADRLSLAGLAEAASSLGERARAGRLRLEDIQGGTFTLNNAGALGTVTSMAIINQPQAAILVMDGVVKRPVVVDGDAIAIRPMMNLCISFDHRINDGLQATRFVSTVRDALQAMDDRVIA